MPMLDELSARLPDTSISMQNLRTLDIVKGLSDGDLDLGMIRKTAVSNPLKTTGSWKYGYRLFVPKRMRKEVEGEDRDGRVGVSAVGLDRRTRRVQAAVGQYGHGGRGRGEYPHGMQFPCTSGDGSPEWKTRRIPARLCSTNATGIQSGLLRSSRIREHETGTGFCLASEAQGTAPRCWGSGGVVEGVSYPILFSYRRNRFLRHWESSALGAGSEWHFGKCEGSRKCAAKLSEERLGWRRNSHPRGVCAIPE